MLPPGFSRIIGSDIIVIIDDINDLNDRYMILESFQMGL